MLPCFPHDQVLILSFWWLLVKTTLQECPSCDNEVGWGVFPPSHWYRNISAPERPVCTGSLSAGKQTLFFIQWLWSLRADHSHLESLLNQFPGPLRGSWLDESGIGHEAFIPNTCSEDAGLGWAGLVTRLPELLLGISQSERGEPPLKRSTRQWLCVCSSTFIDHRFTRPDNRRACVSPQWPLGE